MKYTKANLLNKSFLENEIAENFKYILSNVNFSTNFINIHIQKREETIYDYPRMFFILETISRLYKNKLLEVDKDEMLKIFWNIYDKAKKNSNIENFRYVDMYGMRCLNNFGEDYTRPIENFSKNDFASIFTYPVASYVYISTYNECKKLKELFAYSEVVYMQSIQVFDYILSSKEKNKYLPFHFSELSLWPDKLPKYLVKNAYDFINQNLDKNLNKNCSSSGAAKLLEHCTRIEDFQSIEKIFIFLENRNIHNNINYINFKNPKLREYKNIYNENNDGQYICLDTNGHIIHSLLNLYEKL